MIILAPKSAFQAPEPKKVQNERKGQRDKESRNTGREEGDHTSEGDPFPQNPGRNASSLIIKSFLRRVLRQRKDEGMIIQMIEGINRHYAQRGNDFKMSLNEFYSEMMTNTKSLDNYASAKRFRTIMVFRVGKGKLELAISRIIRVIFRHFLVEEFEEYVLTSNRIKLESRQSYVTQREKLIKMVDSLDEA